MESIKRPIFITALSIAGLLLAVGCASTKKATIATAWNQSVDWQLFTSAELVGDAYAVLQNEEDLLILEDRKGAAVVNEVRKNSGGVFAAFGKAIKESVQNPLSAKNDVSIRYWHKFLPGSEVLLLFDRSKDEGTIRAIQPADGTEKWTSTQLPWNLEKFRDEANFAVELLAQSSLQTAMGADVLTNVMLQTRAIDGMIAEVPGKNAFLFRTVDGNFQMIDTDTGKKHWETEDMSSTGIAAVTYLEGTNQLLVAGDMAGLKDIIKSADAQETMKQLYLFDADTGKLQWATKYLGREEQVRSIKKVDNLVHISFYGGSVELFNSDKGTRNFGTRDSNMMGTTRTASAMGGEYGIMETRDTAEPQFEGDFVYAVNPAGTRVVGMPDKKITKFNYRTGEVVWESPVLEKTPDIRDLLVRDDVVLARISMNTPDEGLGVKGNIVGGTKELGMYAFDKDTGKELWSYTEPFSKHISNVIYGDREGWAAGKNSVFKFDLNSGEVMAESTLEDPDVGTIYMLHEKGTNEILVRGQNGFAMIGKDSLKAEYGAEYAGRLQTYRLDDRYYYAMTEKLLSEKQTLYVYDLKANRKVTAFTLERPEQRIRGNIYNMGYAPLRRSQLLMTITPTGLKSYRME
ncbi:PQQ-binding-like beta-propeller repeat protein [Fodinibius halophilus]|uniref:PQQ-binding-like beta-propeller repeat protein n=1 Tax=Fodinibius halophilus TaxID=1736908 RepID=A0A6M1TAN6_9BACT|nr:PQQ-binding-like beta-propeller repeat protein [Fodinibius halophilus]NGP88034.1 PQQ-binding-like beta-propeller repeat protein [Fodinibius halophilus]